MGWTQLASLPANEECQCANGNVVRISGKGFQILSLRSEGNKTTNVTTDLLGTQTLYHKVSIGLEMPGGQQTERVLEGTDAYCAQVCFKKKEVQERIIEYAKYLMIST